MRWKQLGYALLAIGIICSLFIARGRFQVEKANRTVEIVVDVAFLGFMAPESEQGESGLFMALEAEQGVPHLYLDDASLLERLKELKQAGATTLAVPYGTLSKLVAPEYYRLPALAGQAGLLISPRFQNPDSFGLPELLATLEIVDSRSVGTVVFAGEEVLGYRRYIADVARDFAEKEIIPGVVEFANQRGMKELSRLLDYRVVRVHGIKGQELAAMSQDQAVKRLLRAVRERNARVLYLRPFPDYTRKENVEYIREVVEGLKANGYQVGKAQPFAPLAFWRGRGRGQLILVRQVLALLVAVSFPVAGVLFALRYLEKAGRRPGRYPAWLAALLAFLRATLFSLCGALFLIALLSENSFMLSLEQFRGVKVMHVLPIFLLGGCYTILHRGIQWHLLSFMFGVRASQRKAALALAGVLAVAGLALMVARTGNNVFAAPKLEIMFRDFLEEVLVIRPRTKEFLFGHPLLYLGLFFFYTQGKRNPVPFLFLLLGIVGQASLINTFAHIHTPLLVSGIRTAYGLGFGLVIALVLVGLLSRSGVRIFPRPQRRSM